MERLNPIGMQGGCFNINDQEKFRMAIQLLKESLFDKGATFFCADNIITWGKNYSFLRDNFFLNVVQSKKYTLTEQSIVWRSYVLLYFASISKYKPGDFLELGCHTGNTASLVLSKIDFSSLNKQYYLYDLFKWEEGDEHAHLEGHNNPRMYEDVVDRFSAHDFVHVIKGSVPESFVQGFPETIAFCHIDMNHPDPEAGALEQVLPHLSSGGVVVFDDYGWWGYSAQKMRLDPIAAAHGLEILELPTGQGILIKP